jgi:hypothetical protein
VFAVGKHAELMLHGCGSLHVVSTKAAREWIFDEGHANSIKVLHDQQV